MSKRIIATRHYQQRARDRNLDETRIYSLITNSIVKDLPGEYTLVERLPDGHKLFVVITNKKGEVDGKRKMVNYIKTAYLRSGDG